jgi:dTDP-4-dehydrorhamnose reductase
MRILLTGATGQIGWELRRTLAPLGEIVAPGRSELDLSRPDSIGEIVHRLRPAIIVNAAAYTAVDRAESEPELAMTVNAEAPRALARAARDLGALMVHFSTDYVFDGRKPTPYTEDDEPASLNAYGRSKLAGDRAVQEECERHLIFRTSWIYGNRGNNFLRTIQKLAQEQKEIRVVDDQFGAPTWSREVAETVTAVLAKAMTAGGLNHAYLRERRGLYHLTASGSANWYEFAQQIVDRLQLQTRIVPVGLTTMCQTVSRPLNSRLDCAKGEEQFGIDMASWREGLGMCLANTRPK